MTDFNWLANINTAPIRPVAMSYNAAKESAHEALSMATDAIEARDMSQSPTMRAKLFDDAVRRLNIARDHADTLVAIAAADEAKLAAAMSELQALLGRL